MQENMDNLQFLISIFTLSTEAFFFHDLKGRRNARKHG